MYGQEQPRWKKADSESCQCWACEQGILDLRYPGARVLQDPAPLPFTVDVLQGLLGRMSQLAVKLREVQLFRLQVPGGTARGRERARNGRWERLTVSGWGQEAEFSGETSLIEATGAIAGGNPSPRAGTDCRLP